MSRLNNLVTLFGIHIKYFSKLILLLSFRFNKSKNLNLILLSKIYYFLKTIINKFNISARKCKVFKETISAKKKKLKRMYTFTSITLIFEITQEGGREEYI